MNCGHACTVIIYYIFENLRFYTFFRQNKTVTNIALYLSVSYELAVWMHHLFPENLNLYLLHYNTPGGFVIRRYLLFVITVAAFELLFFTITATNQIYVAKYQDTWQKSLDRDKDRDSNIKNIEIGILFVKSNA